MVAEPAAKSHKLLLVLRGLGPFFQQLAIPDGAFPGVVGQLEILRQFQSVRRTGVLAKPAEHAAAQVVSESGEFLAAGFLVSFTGNDDQMLRACQSAEVAGDTHGLVRVGIHVEPWRSAIAFCHLWSLQRILLGVDLFGVLVTKSYAQALHQVH